MRIFKTKWFARYAHRAKITDEMLCKAIEHAERGLIDAELGGGVIKQRIARKGQGQSKGYRTIIAYKLQKRAVFLYGFAKNERENVSDDELASLKEIAIVWIKMNDHELIKSVDKGLLQEVKYEKKI